MFLVQPHLAPSVLEFQPIFFCLELFPFQAFFKPVFGTFELFWGACRSYFWGWGQAKNIFATFSCRLSNLVLEVDPYLSVSNSATFWAFFALFGSSGAILRPGLGSKTFLEATYID